MTFYLTISKFLLSWAQSVNYYRYTSSSLFTLFLIDFLLVRNLTFYGCLFTGVILTCLLASFSATIEQHISIHYLSFNAKESEFIFCGLLTSVSAQVKTEGNSVFINDWYH